MNRVTDTQVYNALSQGGCTFFSCQLDRNHEVAIVYCSHPAAHSDCEGNCRREECPTGRWGMQEEELSNGNQ